MVKQCKFGEVKKGKNKGKCLKTPRNKKQNILEKPILSSQAIISIVIGIILFITNRFVEGLFLRFLLFFGGIFLVIFGILKLIGISQKVFLFLLFGILALVSWAVPDPLPFIDEIITLGLTIKFGIDALREKKKND